MKISIIIPVFNAVNTIRRAIASVDTKQNYEIICINDGSTDDSKIELEMNTSMSLLLIKRIKVRQLVEMLGLLI